MLLQRVFLQHLPDFKGIETNVFMVGAPNVRACSTSLTSKGLRRMGLEERNFFLLQHLPDFKGIETSGSAPHHLFCTCSTSLTSKGLRLLTLQLCCCCYILQHLPDFKGIETLQPQPERRPFLLQHLPDFKGIETSH